VGDRLPSLALNTTMRGCEIRGLRWADVDLDDNTLTIRKSKTDAGLRVIPVTDAAVDVLLRLRKRSEMFGLSKLPIIFLRALSRWADSTGEK